MIPDCSLSHFILQPFLLIQAQFFQIFICFFDIFVLLCHILELLPALPSEKTHPADDSVFVLILRRQFLKLQNMQLHQVRILLSRLHITERDLPVTSLILREVDEIQDTDMDALLQFIVIITFLNLAGIDLAHIEEHPVRPVFKVGNLHLHIHLNPVFQFHQHVQDPQLIIL